MTVPFVQFKKASFGAGAGSPGTIGIAAIIAASLTGTQNQVSGYSSDAAAYAVFSDGPLVQYASYITQEAEAPVVLCRPTTATAGAYLNLTTTGGGTSAVTNDGTVLPSDKYSNVTILFSVGATIGVAGAMYTYSLDGVNFSAAQALGTANKIVLPNGAGQVNFGAGTVLAAQKITFDTQRPLPTNTDLPASFTALQNTRIPWEGVLIDVEYASGTIGVVDTWLKGLEAQGQFHFAVINTRMKTRPTLTSGDATDRVCVGTDGADYTSTMHGYSQERPTALFLMGRLMAIPVGEDAAYVATGPVGGATIADSSGNPRHHDEDLNPGLDALRLVTLRGFANPGPEGTYITSPNILSSQPTSAYRWAQHLRTMNLACSVAWAQLVTQLRRGVSLKAPDKVTGAVYISDADRTAIDGLVNVPVQAALKKQVTSVAFALSTDDDLSVDGAPITAQLQIVKKAYIQGVIVTTTFVKGITISP
jgi:hypothetical protein